MENLKKILLFIAVLKNKKIFSLIKVKEEKGDDYIKRKKDRL